MPVKSSDPTELIPVQRPISELEPLSPVPIGEVPPVEALEAPWLTVLSWVFPMLLMTGLGLIALASPGLWEDELATWGMVTAPWPEFWHVLRNTDATIGPYYVLIRLWSEAFGTTDLALRLPSVLAMAGAVALLSWLGVRLGGRRVGAAAGTLFAVLPMTSRYAQEARPYALTVFAAVLATLLVVRLVERPGFWRYLAYGAAIVILGLSHVVALLLIAAHAVIFWKLRTGGRAVVGWLVAVAIAVMPVFPVLYLGSKQAGAQIQWIPEVTLRRVAETPEALVGGAVLAGAVAALALIAMSMRESALIATTRALFPAMGLLAVSEVTPMWIPRYLLFTLPAWALLGSMALRNVSILRGLGAIAMIGMLAVPAQTTIRGPGG